MIVRYFMSMKKIVTIAMIAACAMMVYSCKNNGKGEKEAAEGECVENCCEGSDEKMECCEEGAGSTKAAADAAAKEGADRSGDLIEQLDGIVPYTSVEVKPTFNGGDADSFVKYVQDNIEYPQAAIDNDESGRVTVNFVVGTDGKIRNAKVVKGVSETLDAEALRVVNSAPAWAPAKQDGKNVPVTCSIPVTFKLVK